MFAKLKEIISGACRVCGFEIIRTKDGKIKRDGISFCDDVKKRYENVATIFDIGAHHGGSTIKFRQKFEASDIYSFEPVESNYEKIRNNIQGEKIKVYNIGMSDTKGEKEIYIKEDSKNHSVEKSKKGDETEKSEFSTVDNFCDKKSIQKIGILKVDTEGHDVSVLKGAKSMLEKGGVKFVLAEVTLQREDSDFCNFVEVRDILYEGGFKLMGVYDQTINFDERHMPLLFANAGFVHNSVSV